MIVRLHKFVRHHAVEDHLRLGWVMTAALCGTWHGQYSRHMIWLCACRPVEPRMPEQWNRVSYLQHSEPPMGRSLGT